MSTVQLSGGFQDVAMHPFVGHVEVTLEFYDVSAVIQIDFFASVIVVSEKAANGLRVFVVSGLSKYCEKSP